MEKVSVTRSLVHKLGLAEEQLFGHEEMSERVKDDVFGRSPEAERRFMEVMEETGAEEVVTEENSSREKREAEEEPFSCEFLRGLGMNVILLEEQRLESMDDQDLVECLNMIVLSKGDRVWMRLILSGKLSNDQMKTTLKHHPGLIWHYLKAIGATVSQAVEVAKKFELSPSCDSGQLQLDSTTFELSNISLKDIETLMSLPCFIYHNTLPRTLFGQLLGDENKSSMHVAELMIQGLGKVDLRSMPRSHLLENVLTNLFSMRKKLTHGKMTGVFQDLESAIRLIAE